MIKGRLRAVFLLIHKGVACAAKKGYTKRELINKAKNMRNFIAKWTVTATLVASFGGFALAPAVAQAAVNPGWDVTGHYSIAFMLTGSPDQYVHSADLVQTGTTVTGQGGYMPAAVLLNHWNVTSGSVTADQVTLTIIYDAGEPSTPGTVMNMTGTIAPDGTMSGTWNDNYLSGTRTGTWHTTQGAANVTNVVDWGSELSADSCKGKTGAPVVNMTQKVVNDVDSGQGGNNWAMDAYNRHVQIWQTNNTAGWNLVGTHEWVVLNTYHHDITITSQDVNGNFIGTGSYPAGEPSQTTETITGNITGNTISFTTLYAGPYNPGYTETATGTIASDGSISGSNPWTWTLLGKATMGKKYCALVTYEGKASAVAGQKGPGGTGTIGTGVTAVMKGGYRATFNGTLNPSPVWKTKGSIGTVDYKCDLSGAACVYQSWASKYFTNTTDFTQDWWGWLYQAGVHGSWLNSIEGNSGNIL